MGVVAFISRLGYEYGSWRWQKLLRVLRTVFYSFPFLSTLRLECDQNRWQYLRLNLTTAKKWSRFRVLDAKGLVVYPANAVLIIKHAKRHSTLKIQTVHSWILLFYTFIITSILFINKTKNSYRLHSRRTSSAAPTLRSLSRLHFPFGETPDKLCILPSLWHPLQSALTRSITSLACGSEDFTRRSTETIFQFN